MAITAIEYSLFRLLRVQNALPPGAAVLELGEANWYGDVALDLLKQDIAQYAPEAARDPLLRRLDDILTAQRPTVQFEIAKLFWAVFVQPDSMIAIDFGGTDQALRLDLNGAVDLGKRFDIVMNLGTAEHVFNVAQLFKTIHDHTAPGGLMIHGLPFSGWVDHGFFSFNSTFYWDLAAANNYAVVVAVYAELNPLKLVQLHKRESILELAKNQAIGRNSLIYTIFRRPDQAAGFRIPMQGYYANAISPEATSAWMTLR